MKRSTYAILAGTMAFGLTAAAASLVAFQVGDVESVPGTNTDTATVIESPCTGTYNITWTIDQQGYVTGFQADRTTTDSPDSGLQYCVSMPAWLQLGDQSNSTYYYGTTDGTTGDFSGTFALDSQSGAPIIAVANMTVSLTIGPSVGSGL